SGSVRPKQPILSMRAIGGGHFFFFSFHPANAVGPTPRPVGAPEKGGDEGTAPALSLITKPHSKWIPPGQPQPRRPRPPMVSSLKAGSSSNGKASSTQYLLMMGATLVPMKARTRLRIASSSAGSVSANS